MTDEPRLAVDTHDREDQGAVPLQRPSPLENLERLDGERNGVRVPGLHTLIRDLPTRAAEIDLFPLRASGLAETGIGQHDEQHHELYGLLHRKVLPSG